MTFTLPPLPYDLDAFSPYMGSRALDLHYNVLHRRYVEKVNQLLPPAWKVNDLFDVIAQAEKGPTELFHAALQAWNHEFFWQCMRPPTPAASEAWGPLRVLIKRDFGSMAKLREGFVHEGTHLFGSGWVWLCMTPKKKLVIEALEDASNPILFDRYPLLVCDVWEHAYYPDYGPERKHFLTTWFDKLANFDFAAHNTRRVLQALL